MTGPCATCGAVADAPPGRSATRRASARARVSLIFLFMPAPSPAPPASPPCRTPAAPATSACSGPPACSRSLAACLVPFSLPAAACSGAGSRAPPSSRRLAVVLGSPAAPADARTAPPSLAAASAAARASPFLRFLFLPAVCPCSAGCDDAAGVCLSGGCPAACSPSEGLSFFLFLLEGSIPAVPPAWLILLRIVGWFCRGLCAPAPGAEHSHVCRSATCQ